MRPLPIVSLCWLAAFAQPAALAQAPVPAVPPLRIVVPVGPGGSSDGVARLLAERMAPLLRRPIVVENRPGGTGRLAVEALRAAAPADALLVAPIALVVTAPLAFAKWPWQPQDLAPVAQLSTFDYAFVVGAQSRHRTFTDFAAWARAQPTASHFAGVGNGSVPHFAGLLIARDAGFATSFVSYADIGRLEADLAGGHVASAVAATSDVLALHRSGRLRVLATTGRVRSVPGVPTLRELGYPALEIAGWNALFAHPRLPAADVEALARAANEALRDPAVLARMRDAGLVPTGSTPTELGAIIARDIALWTPVIRASGFVADAP